MTVENSIESYLFTCVRCGARWTEDYQVSQLIDDAGAFRSFYRHRGTPCEAPVSGNIECPRCHATRARRDPLYGLAPELNAAQCAGLPLAVPAQRVPEGMSAPPHHGPGTWHRFKFAAVVTMDATGRGQYLSGVPGLMVRAPSCRLPARRQYFPAVVFTDDDRPLRPGDRGIHVIMSVPDDDAGTFFQAGQHFALWDGTDVGHGTVAQRLVFQGLRC